MNKFTFQEMVDAHKSADKSLLTIELSNPPRVRFRVMNILTGKTIKTFKVSTVPVEVFRWIDEQYPNGVFIYSTRIGDRKRLRYGGSNIDENVIKRAYEMTKTDGFVW